MVFFAKITLSTFCGLLVEDRLVQLLKYFSLNHEVPRDTKTQILCFYDLFADSFDPSGHRGSPSKKCAKMAQTVLQACFCLKTAIFFGVCCFIHFKFLEVEIIST